MNNKEYQFTWNQARKSGETRSRKKPIKLTKRMFMYLIMYNIHIEERKTNVRTLQEPL